MAAAVITLVFMATDPRMKRSPRGVEQDHRAAAVSDVRLASDKTVRELPNVMVESRSIPGTDKIELFYIRQTLERAVVTGAYTLGHNEVGQPFKAKLAGFPATGAGRCRRSAESWRRAERSRSCRQRPGRAPRSGWRPNSTAP